MAVDAPPAALLSDYRPSEIDVELVDRYRAHKLAEVNGRVFVNNVSLGLYAATVQRAGYRDAKLQTLLDTVPDVLGPNGAPHQLRWTGPDGGGQTASAAIIMSNNHYRLARNIGWGTRPRIDTGVLGIAASIYVQEPLRAGASGRPPPLRSVPKNRSRPGSTGRPSCSTRRCGSASCPMPCAFASRVGTPVFRHPRKCPRPSATAYRHSHASRSAAKPQGPRRVDMKLGATGRRAPEPSTPRMSAMSTRAMSVTS